MNRMIVCRIELAIATISRLKCWSQRKILTGDLTVDYQRLSKLRIMKGLGVPKLFHDLPSK